MMNSPGPPEPPARRKVGRYLWRQPWRQRGQPPTT